MIDVTEKRKRALRSRLSDESWRSRWREALDDLAKCPFLLGGNDRGWKANFDWFIRPDSVTKILEGAYRGQPTVRITGQMPFDREDASKFDVLKARTHICYNDPSSSRGLQGPDSVHSREAR